MQTHHLSTISHNQTEDYSQVVKEFLEFRDAVEQDCTILSLTQLSKLIGSIRLYFYQNERKNQWSHLIAYLYQEKEKYLLVDYVDLEENFKLTLDTASPFHWKRLCNLICEINLYIKTYQLNMRDLIRMNHLTESNLTIAL